MKLTKKQLELISKTNQFIFEKYDYFHDYKFQRDSIYSDEDIEEIIQNDEDKEYIEFDFPGEHDEFEVPTSSFLDLCPEIVSIKIINKHHIKTNLRSYYIVGTTDSYDEYKLNEYQIIETHNENNITVKLLQESLIIGLVATELGEYDNDYWGTATQYLTIEISYKSEKDRLTDEEELKLLNAYIFEIADTTNIALQPREIHCPTNDFTGWDEEEVFTLRELEPFNEGMILFTSAVQINDPELKFLNFYKVLEHFSPVAINIEANELMRKKLDAPKSSFESGDFIRSIYDLANSMKSRDNDEDLIKTAFNTCTDFVENFNFLPESVKKKVKKAAKSPTINYSTDKQTIITATNAASKIIYKTRNKVVHAKSNFSKTGEEVSSSDFKELNIFMKKASSQAIRWYSRQPNHYKLKIIE